MACVVHAGVVAKLILIVFLANVLSVYGDYSRELLEITKKDADDENQEAISAFVRRQIEPRHAVAVVVVGKGTKRNLLVEELARDELLQHLLCLGALFAKGPSSISLYLHSKPYPLNYTGKWARGALHAWLKDNSYPLVNKMANQFAPPKYLTMNPYGAVIRTAPLAAINDESVKELEPFATKYRDRLRFTFFTMAPTTQDLCDMFGIFSNDELLLLEKPNEIRKPGQHSHTPGSPKYRLEGVTPQRLEDFFAAYDNGTLPRYYKPKSKRGPVVVREGIRELTSWDFVDVVYDPHSAVLVEFISADCHACDEFSRTFREIARKIKEIQQKDESSFLRDVVVARIDQSTNEHSEIVKGTPWLRYWPKQTMRQAGKEKRGIDVESRSVEGVLNFLEVQATVYAEAEAEDQAKTKKKAQRSVDTCNASSQQDCRSNDKTTASHPSGEAEMRKVGEPEIQLGKPEPGLTKGYLSTEMDPDEFNLY